MNETEILVLLEATTQEIEQSIVDQTKLLEATVSEIIRLDPRNITGVRFALQEFQRRLPESLAPLRTVAQSMIQQFEEPAEPEDAALIDQLFEAAVENTRSSVLAATGAILALIYTGLATAEDSATIARRAAGKISGVFVETTDRLARSAQRELAELYAQDQASREQIQLAVRVIRQQLASIDLSADLRAALRNKVSDVVYDFHGAFVLARATRLGYTRFRYAGGVVRNSRDFCITHVGKIYTMGEIQRIWRGRWAGKRPGDPMVVRGGYNCRHFWIPTR